jgi:ATP/maltotriose-dependent transcriptional regulator MalT
MELIERDECLETLQSKFENLSTGEGHCIFISGEAGIGKTSLVKSFTKKKKAYANIYIGSCDALFAPRPLAPLYDVLLQLENGVPQLNNAAEDRTAFFTHIFRLLKEQEKPSLLIFEDIHWADEATLDFIKFFARRISYLRCLFILTYRDNEITPEHPLKNVIGQLNPDTFSRISLSPLSRQAVDTLARERGYNGEDVYSISGGNPFYVTEILASYSQGIPDNIRDSVLSAYNRLEDNTKCLWATLSVLPTAFEVVYLEKMEPAYATAVHNCLYLNILIIENGKISFKHELFRRTIEASLSPLVRVDIHKKILGMFQESFENKGEIERIIHHAKNANDYDRVVHYAPIAAKEAANVGAHREASKLYLTAIEFYQGRDMDVLIPLYEAYAYECYLTYQVNEAIIYASRSLESWKEKKDSEKIGDCLRFLSRLWWLAGNRAKAEYFGEQAIQVFLDKPASKAKAMVFSNLSQLKMLYHEPVQCIFWGEKAIEMANSLDDEETLAHALNNVGTARMWTQASKREGIELLQQSLQIALKNSYHEHAARAYTNLGSNCILIKDFTCAEHAIEEGIRYCEERDLDSWKTYMLGWKARLKMDTGDWKEAEQIAGDIIKNDDHAPYVKVGALSVLGTIKMRKGLFEEAFPLLLEAQAKGLETLELQRIIPALSALLEYEWITGKKIVEQTTIDIANGMLKDLVIYYEYNELSFWLRKARNQLSGVQEIDDMYDTSTPEKSVKLAERWERCGCPYEQAVALFESGEEDKRKAIAIVQSIGADAVYEKMKFEMRSAGIKSIPRGIRKTTQSNPALLTDRELDVLQLLGEGLQNKEIAARLFISAKTVDHHISSILYKLEVKSRTKAVHEAARMGILKIGNHSGSK